MILIFSGCLFYSVLVIGLITPAVLQLFPTVRLCRLSCLSFISTPLFDSSGEPIDRSHSFPRSTQIRR